MCLYHGLSHGHLCLGGQEVCSALEIGRHETVPGTVRSDSASRIRADHEMPRGVSSAVKLPSTPIPHTDTSNSTCHAH